MAWPAATEAAIRVWCEQMARRLERERILRDGQPYLERYFVRGWSPTTRAAMPSVFLHHFVASDPLRQVHSHPWGCALSLILVGGYREQRCGGDGIVECEYWPGDINVLTADVRHRIDLLEGECWTLFLIDAYAQPWEFFPSC